MKGSRRYYHEETLQRNTTDARGVRRRAPDGTNGTRVAWPPLSNIYVRGYSFSDSAEETRARIKYLKEDVAAGAEEQLNLKYRSHRGYL